MTGRRPGRVPWLAAALAAGGLFLAGAAAGEDEPLARRGDLGLTTDDRIAGGGAFIREVDPAGPAALAGLAPGDQIVAIDGEPVRSAAGLRRAIARLRGGEVVRLGLHHGRFDPARGEFPVDGELLLSARLRPRETADGLDVDYGEIRAGDVRLRSVTVRPGDGAGPWPAVLLLPDFQGSPCDETGPNPDRDLAQLLARASLLVMRYDPRGVGDSEGGAWGDVGFDLEVEDARAALAALLSRDDVDRSRVVLLGRGTGASLAALVGDARGEVAGVAGFGLRSRRLVEWFTAITRHQNTVLGVQPAEAGRLVDVVARTMSLIVSGVPPDECRRLIPESVASWDPEGHFFAKAPAYWREQNEADVTAAWTRVRGPVLLLRGTHDVNSLPEEYTLLARALEEARHPAHRFEEVPGLDLDLGRVTSDRQATLRYSRGDRTADGAADLATRLAEWIRELPPVGPPADRGR